MPDVLEQVKISELPEASNYANLFTIGAEGNQRSVKVPLAAVAKIGNPASLTTEDKSTLVAAINELVQMIVAMGNTIDTLNEKFVFLTEAEFEALTTYDSTKIYCTYEG